MTANIEPLSITISPRDGGRYKSISNLTWDNIPGFAVVTGKNGAGKTQLLEVLAYHFSGTVPPSAQSSPLPVLVQASGEAYRPDEIGYVPSDGRFSGGGGVTLANLPNVRRQALQTVTNAQTYRHDIGASVCAHKILKRLGSISPHQIDPTTLAEVLADDFEYGVDDVDVTGGLCNLFLAHRLKIFGRPREALERVR
jgi:ABC-type Mn2+/Zn2+ transport system ATPase subunit